MAAENTATVVASGTVALGTTGTANVGTIVLQGTDTGWDGTVIIKGKVKGSAATAVPIPYKRRSLIAAASDDTIVSATITDTAFLIEINASGLDVSAVCTRTAGTLVLEWVTLAGIS
jgi:hypothetical protein